MGGLLSLFAQIEPDLHVQDVVTVPGILWFLGAAVWFFAVLGRRQGKAPRWKWLLAYLFMILATLGALFGWGGDPDKHLGVLSYITHQFGVREEYGNKKLLIGLFGSFLLPVISMVVMRIVDKREERFLADLVS